MALVIDFRRYIFRGTKLLSKLQYKFIPTRRGKIHKAEFENSIKYCFFGKNVSPSKTLVIDNV